MARNISFQDDLGRLTSLFRSGKNLRLTMICEFKCAPFEVSRGQPTGMFILEDGEEDFSGEQPELISIQTTANSLKARWVLRKTGLEWHSIWDLDIMTGIWSRRDRLVNQGENQLQIRKALARFPFSGSGMEVYIQRSHWAHENQGEWLQPTTGATTLQCQAGRTNQGASPYLFLRSQMTETNLALHLLPRGNWGIHLQRSESGTGAEEDQVIIDLGPSDEGLKLKLGPGVAFDLPEILIEPVPSRQPEMGAPILHRYSLSRCYQATSERKGGVKSFAPLVYNTWFDSFDSLQVPRLRDQLKAAQEIGCEVFVVDAGWYGNGEGPWDRQVGDWTEKRRQAFQGRMKEFAEEVRSAGLGFGLWMEPERVAGGAPILNVHPEWFLPCPYRYFSPDLSQQPARDYLEAEISRLIETYQLAWIKIDFNLEMGQAEDGQAGYYQEWYQMLDRIRGRYPRTFFEGCASGGMRLELQTLRHFDGHFLSDTVHPIEMLRITQGALLRVPPGRLTRWAVLRPAPGPGQVLTPGGANWDHPFSVSVDFACRAALPGMFGYSGDLTGLPIESRQRLRQHNEFYKNWREFLTRSICHLVTPVEGINNRDGWAAFQFQSPERKGLNLVAVYRLDDDRPEKNIPLRELEPRRSYHITENELPKTNIGELSGKELMDQGLPAQLASKFSAKIYIVRASADSP